MLIVAVSSAKKSVVAACSATRISSRTWARHPVVVVAFRLGAECGGEGRHGRERVAEDLMGRAAGSEHLHSALCLLFTPSASSTLNCQPA